MLEPSAGGGPGLTSSAEATTGILDKAQDALKKFWAPISTAITNSKVGQVLAKIGGPVLTKIVGLVAPNATVAPIAATVTGGALIAGAGFLTYKGIKFALKHKSLKQSKELSYSY